MAMARIDGGALAFAVLHDLVGAAAFVASHPLHAAYAYFFSRGLLALAAFFRPLLLSTSLLLVVLLTAAPYVAPGWPGARCLGSTCGIALAALCSGMRPGGAGLGLVGQLCSFVLGPAGVGEIALVGDDDDGPSCFLLEEESFAVDAPLPLWSLGGEEICFMGNGEFCYEEEILGSKDEIQEKNVVSEDLKAPNSSSPSSSSDHCFPGETFMPEMGEGREKSVNKVQSVSLPVREGGSDDGVEEKRLECDPTVPTPAMETKKGERVSISKPPSLISQRIRQWESGNVVKQVVDEDPVEICLVKESFEGVDELETESWDQKQSESRESIDVKEALVQWKVAEKCIGDLQDDAQPDGDGEGYQEEREQEEAEGGESPVVRSTTTTSIARRVHARTSSENVTLAGEGSPGPGKGKEWKRTLACKLYEERAQLKLCRDRAVAGPCADDMDMLWEAYETGGGSGSNVPAAVDAKRVAASDAKRGGGSTKEAFVDEEEEDDEEEEEEDDGPVPALCCLQALKFSTRKMSLGGGGGKPSMAKFSRVLKRMTALSRVGSRRKG